MYLNKEDIFSIESNRREVFAKSVLNINNFGKLTIMSDGNVYSNINNTKIGNIEQSLYELIEFELKNGDSWFNYRKRKPCNECIYQFLVLLHLIMSKLLTNKTYVILGNYIS